MIVDVTPGRVCTQARATAAGVGLTSRATRISSSTMAQFRSVNADVTRSPRAAVTVDAFWRGVLSSQHGAGKGRPRRHGRDRRPAMEACEYLRFDNFPAPSAAHQIVERPHRLVDGCVVIPAVHPVQVDVRLSIVVAGTSSRMM